MSLLVTFLGKTSLVVKGLDCFLAQEVSALFSLKAGFSFQHQDWYHVVFKGQPMETNHFVPHLLKHRSMAIDEVMCLGGLTPTPRAGGCRMGGTPEEASCHNETILHLALASSF